MSASTLQSPLMTEPEPFQGFINTGTADFPIAPSALGFEGLRFDITDAQPWSDFGNGLLLDLFHNDCSVPGGLGLSDMVSVSF